MPQSSDEENDVSKIEELVNRIENITRECDATAHASTVTNFSAAL